MISKTVNTILKNISNNLIIQVFSRMNPKIRYEDYANIHESKLSTSIKRFNFYIRNYLFGGKIYIYTSQAFLKKKRYIKELFILHGSNKQVQAIMKISFMSINISTSQEDRVLIGQNHAAFYNRKILWDYIHTHTHITCVPTQHIE